MVAEVFSYLPGTLQLLLAAVAVFIGGFLRGFVGFGGALTIIPALALIFTPKEAVAMHIIMEIPGTLQLLPAAARQSDLRTVLPTLIAIIIGMPFGVYLLTVLDPQPMRIAISLIVLVVVGLLARNWRYSGHIGPSVMAGIGAIGGLAQGSTGMGGPPIVTVLMSRRDDIDVLRGNILATMAGLIIAAIPMQWAFGILTPKAIMLGLLAGPIYVLATYAGSRHYRLGGNRFYRATALCVLAAVATASLIASLR
jgi:uncharacterized membrane protein YfcA